MPKKNEPALTSATLEELVFNSNWPILKTYEGAQLRKLALPLGGIGTGTVSLGGRGDLRDWELMNRPAKGFTPFPGPRIDVGPMLTLWAQPRNQPPLIRLLEGPAPVEDYEGNQGARIFNGGMPRFRKCKFGAAYPFGQVALSDPEVPVLARIEAFNPLIPGDPDASGIPVAVLRVVLTNTTDAELPVSVALSVPNFIGCDGSRTKPGWGSMQIPVGCKGNFNTLRESPELTGIFMQSAGVHPEAEAWGTLALSTIGKSGVSTRTGWAALSWGDSLLDFWDDFLADGKLEERDPKSALMPMASLCVNRTLAPRATTSITFLLTWHFPNRPGWNAGHSDEKDEKGELTYAISPEKKVINHYATQSKDAWDAALKFVPRMAELESQTLSFVRAFCGSDMPDEAKEAALFNLSTLRTQTVFRAEGGRLFGWEGSHDNEGSCPGSCTHVWNYEQSTAFLFGELARTMREVEFNHTTDDTGAMSFRVGLPLATEARALGKTAADGQTGCLMKLYREWKLSGDDAFLRSVWQRAKLALEYCWLEGGWDADEDGVMEGCQHNTMDVEYFGPNPQMTGWYLGALRATHEMARHLGEEAFAARCQALFERGRAWMDAHLFNGDYYEQKIVSPGKNAKIRPEQMAGMGSLELVEPELQIGSGCLIDQMVGQTMAHVCGLAYLHDPEKARAAARSVLRFNHRSSFWGHFNHLRNYALGDEAGLLMASYPRGERPRRPFPYFNEVMTGFEYVAALHLMYEGELEAGLGCVREIRERYDGKRRNPFNEAECGFHYARAMAAWGVVLAFTGFDYDGRSGRMCFAAPREGKLATWFWSNGSAWGTFWQDHRKQAPKFELTVLHGELKLSELEIRGVGVRARSGEQLQQGQTFSSTVE